jgi:hypothetical protein
MDLYAKQVADSIAWTQPLRDVGSGLMPPYVMTSMQSLALHGREGSSINPTNQVDPPRADRLDRGLTSPPD